MTTLTPPDTVVPTVDVSTLRIRPDEKDEAVARARRPARYEEARHFPPLQSQLVPYDDDYEPPVMRLEEVRHKPTPAYVPFAMGRKIGDNEVQWAPRPPRPPAKIDVSIAETVEKSVPPPPQEFYEPPKTKLIAYDDSDPFPSRMRRFAHSQELASDTSGVSMRNPVLHIFGYRVAVFNQELSTLWMVDSSDFSVGWQKMNCLGQAPPIGTVLLPQVNHSLFVAIFQHEYFIIELFEGERDARWVRCSIAMPWNHFTVTWAHNIDDLTFYVRSQTEHALISPHIHASTKKGKERIVDSIASRIVSPMEVLCTATTLRSVPVKEPLQAIEGFPGAALLVSNDHIWLYMFLPKARNFLPTKRIDVCNPLFAMMPGKGLYLFSPPKGYESSAVFQASHRLLPPQGALASLTSLPEIKVEDAKKDGETTLHVQPDQIAVLAPMYDDCILVLAKDLENYVVIQVDQLAKKRKYLEDAEEESAVTAAAKKTAGFLDARKLLG